MKNFRSLATFLLAGVLLLIFAPIASAAAPVAQGNDILQGEALYPGQGVSSANSRYSLVYQTDGNVVLYRNNPGRDRDVLWASETNGRGAGQFILQHDGNLVAYNGSGMPVWDSGTRQTNSRLIVQDDGNVVIYAPGNIAVWATNTAPPPLREKNTLTADRWTKVVYGYGYYKVVYRADIYSLVTGNAVVGARYDCYAGPVKTSGQLPGKMTHQVMGYGDCWLYSPVAARYVLTPLSS